jgi:hypothetical protein
MAANIEVNLVLKNIAESTNQIKKFAADSSKSLQGLESAFGALKVITAIVGAAFSIHKIVDAAEEAEHAVERLNVSLKLSGDFTKAASDGFIQFASSIQRTANVSDEQVLGLVAQAKAIGLTDDQTKKLIKTSVDVAAVMGTDVNDAFLQLERTLSGTVSRSLGQLRPELKRLSTEALVSGEAIRIVGERSAGAAADLGQNFGGQLKGVGIAISEVAEGLGAFIVENPIVVKSLETIKNVLFDLADIIKASVEPGIELFRQGLEFLAGIIADNVKANAPFLAVLFEIGKTLKDVLGVVITAVVIPALTDLFTGMRALDNFLRSALQPVLEFIAKGFKVVAVGALTVVKAIAEIEGKTDAVKQLDATIEKIVASTFEQNDAVKANTKAIADQTGAAKEYIDTLVETEKHESSLTNAKVRAVDIRVAASKKDIAAQRQLIAEQQKAIGSSAAQGGVGQFLFGKNDALEKLKTNKEARPQDIEQAKANVGLIAATSALKDVLAGPQGAVNLISQTVGAFADTIIPGIGGVVGQIVGVLAQGPEAAAGFVRGFIEAIPTIVENIILAIPAVIQALIDGLPTLIERLILGIIEALPRLIQSLATSMPLVATRLAIELAAKAPTIVREFITTFIKEGIPAIVKGFLDEIKKTFASLGGLFGGGGGGGGLGGILGAIPGVGALGGFLGFAEGGTVPGGFPNDSFPASLTSGELVVDRSNTTRLGRFLDQQESGNRSGLSDKIDRLISVLQSGGGAQNLSIAFDLSEQRFAGAQLNLNRQGFRTNG